MSSSENLCLLSARELVRLISSGEASAVEVLDAHMARIERLNPRINAICTLVPDRALAEASEVDRRRAAGDPLGPLAGLPIAIKDLVRTRGIRTTFGSPIYRDNVPEEDALIVERVRAAGAVVIGKTNTPEFGAGSQTFNPVFGVTCNPHDPSLTCGGSSGGAAAALAAGLLPIADGSDLGGSLRNPASFCGVVGFRPSPGRVPRFPTQFGWDDLSVLGPMARDVEDVALLLQAIAGPDPRSPIARPEPGEAFGKLEPRDLRGLRVAWTPDLGRYRVASEVKQVCAQAVSRFADLGAEVGEAAPDLSGVDDIFRTLRAWLFAQRLAADLEGHRDQMKDTVVWNIELGLALSGRDVSRAFAERTALFRRVVAFFERWDVLVLPTVQVLPFDLSVPYPTEIEGEPMTTYLDWMGTCYAITVTTCPAISVPCGKSASGLPVGLQIVAPPGRDRDALEIALAFERVAGLPNTPIELASLTGG